MMMTTANSQANLRPGADAGQQKCFVCNQEIADGGWFCKIPREEEPIVVLCCPGCAFHYFDTVHPTTNANELARAACERNRYSLVDGVTP
jgi:hypothetical protein